MPAVTLPMARDTAPVELTVRGIIQRIIWRNAIMSYIPFVPIQGITTQYAREVSLGDTQYAGPTDAIVANTAAEFSLQSQTLTTLAVQIQVPRIIQYGVGGQFDQMQLQVSSRSKELGRIWQRDFFQGLGINNQISGLVSLVEPDFVQGSHAASVPFNTNLWDDMIESTDMPLDAIVVSRREFKSFIQEMKGLGGTTPEHYMLLDTQGGTPIQAPMYRRIPVFETSLIPTNLPNDTDNAGSYMFGIHFDDGSLTEGVCGIVPDDQFLGIDVQGLGTSFNFNQDETRLAWYTNVVNTNPNSLVMYTGINGQ